MPSGEMDIPGLGKVPDKYVVGGVLTAMGVAVIVYFRAKSKATAAAIQATSQQSSPTGADSGDRPRGQPVHGSRPEFRLLSWLTGR